MRPFHLYLLFFCSSLLFCTCSLTHAHISFTSSSLTSLLVIPDHSNLFRLQTFHLRWQRPIHKEELIHCVHLFNTSIFHRWTTFYQRYFYPGRVIQTLFIRMLVLHLWIKSDGNCCLSPLVLEIKTTLHLSVKVIMPLHPSKHFCSSNRKKENNFISIYSCLFTCLTQLWAPAEMSVVAYKQISMYYRYDRSRHPYVSFKLSSTKPCLCSQLMRKGSPAVKMGGSSAGQIETQPLENCFIYPD